MIKLNAGFSRKVGEPNYGSRGASVNVELEVESGLIGDPDGLLARIRRLFEIARQSVDAELNGGASGSGDHPVEPAVQRHNGEQDSSGRRGPRNATRSQLRAIQAICDRQGLDAAQVAGERFRVDRLEALTLREASSLIDELKSAPQNGRNGDAR